jgi:hypothetical protein
MKSTEVYKVAREVLAPWFKEHGYKRLGVGWLGWYRPVDDRYLSVWLKVTIDGFDAYAGSQFAVELRLLTRPEFEPGTTLDLVRLPALLSQGQREELRRLQNEVLAKLPKPPPGYWKLDLGGGPNVWYLQQFEPVTEPYAYTDIWFRYHDAEDVRMWARFILGVLPECIDRYLLAAAHGAAP